MHDYINGKQESYRLSSTCGAPRNHTNVPPVDARVWRQLLLSAVARVWRQLLLSAVARFSDSYCIFSNIVPKKMGVPLVWRLKLAHYVPKIGKSNKKRCLATIWPLRWCQAKYVIFLLPLFIVPPIYTIIHAWHYIREQYRIICTYDVHRVPFTRTIRTIFWIHTSTMLFWP